MKQRKSGFTLIEIMFVVAIIAILVSVAIPSFSSRASTAEKAVCTANRRNLQTMMMAGYFSGDYDSFQDAFDALYDEGTYSCPSGGRYTWAANGLNGFVICDYHSTGSAPGSQSGSTTSLNTSSSTGTSSSVSTSSNTGASSSVSAGSSGSISSSVSASTSAGASSSVSTGSSRSASSSGSEAGTVTLTDSAGNHHTLHATEAWPVIQEKISNGWNVQDGYVFSDSTGVYLCCSWSQPYLDEDAESLTVAQLAARYPGYFVKLDSSSSILIENDRVESYGNMIWKATVQKGTLCYFNGGYYVAPGTISVWTMPPAGWISVKQ